MTTPLNPDNYDALACTDPNAPLTTEPDPYTFAVSSPRDTYYLSVLSDTCTCPDCVFNRHKCKHLLNVQEIVTANIDRKESRAENTDPAHAAQLLVEAKALRVNLAAVQRLYRCEDGLQASGRIFDKAA